MILWEITIPWDARATCGNPPLHPLAYNRLVKAAKEAAWAVWNQEQRPVLDVPITVHVRVNRGHTMDEARIIVGTECLRDALFAKRRSQIARKTKHTPRRMLVERGLMVPDDSPKWVQLGRVDQVVDRKYRGAETVTFIIEKRP